MGDDYETIRVETEKDDLKCRFYERQYPDIEEIVMVNVTEIGEMGAYVTLLEYDDIEGMILLSELSRRRIRSINKLVRVNKTEVVMVLRVDKEKGYIDLSKRRVDPEDVGRCEDRYNKAKQVHSVLRHIASSYNKTLEEMYQLIGWPLYKKYGHAYDAFKAAISENEEPIFEGLDIDAEMQSSVLTYVKRRLAPQPVKIRADLEVTCFNYEGIDAIKEALLVGEATGPPEAPVKIKLIAPPLYVMTTMTLDKEHGISILNKSIEAIGEAIKANGGSMDLKLAPKAVTQREESELQAMMDRLAVEQEEVDGDDDAEN